MALGCCGLLDCGDVSVVLAVSHHGEEDVEASACECDDCGVVSFVFFAFSFIEWTWPPLGRHLISSPVGLGRKVIYHHA